MISSRRGRFCSRAALSLVALGGVLRFAHWGAPLTGDEGYMVQNYAVLPVSRIVTTYDVPNNHILLSVLLHAIDAVWPKKLLLSLADIRPLQLPGIIASIATLRLLYAVSLPLIGPPAAMLSVAVMAVSYLHLCYSHQLRGYSLSVFLVLLNVLFVQRALRRGAKAWLYALAAALAAAHYLIPTNGLASLALAGWSFHALLRDPARPRDRRLAIFVAAAFAVAAGLTFAEYFPVRGQLANSIHVNRLSMAASLLAVGRRLGSCVGVLGRGRVYPLLLAVVSAAGLSFAARRGGRRASAAILIGLNLCVPVLVFTLQGLGPWTTPERVYLMALPFWAMAVGLGLYAAAAWTRRALALSRGALPALWLGAAGLLLAASCGQVGAFLSWNRGLDLRRIMAALQARAKDIDDYAVVYSAGGELDWDYYGFAASILPGLNLNPNQDFVHRMRSRYFFLATDPEGATASMERSWIDPILRETLKESGSLGRMRVFELSLDEAVLARYREAVASPKTPASLRAQALAGLGYDAMRGEDFAGAVAFLEKAKGLAPLDEKARYYLGLARYMQFDDEKSGAEFEWVVARDTMNASAPYFLAETLACRGRSEEALKWFGWYFGPSPPAASWVLKSRAGYGSFAVRGGKGIVAVDSKSPAGWLKTAQAYYAKGSFERAAVALGRAEPTVEHRVRLASLRANVGEYALAARLLRQAISDGAGIEARAMLARELVLKGSYDEARTQVSAVLAADPGNQQAMTLDKLLRRL